MELVYLPCKCRQRKLWIKYITTFVFCYYLHYACSVFFSEQHKSKTCYFVILWWWILYSSQFLPPSNSPWSGRGWAKHGSVLTPLIWPALYLDQSDENKTKSLKRGSVYLSQSYKIIIHSKSCEIYIWYDEKKKRFITGRFEEKSYGSNNSDLWSLLEYSLDRAKTE